MNRSNTFENIVGDELLAVGHAAERQLVRKSRIGLALAGGGPLGAIYEIGALCALDESLEGLSFTELHHYVEIGRAHV